MYILVSQMGVEPISLGYEPSKLPLLYCERRKNMQSINKHYRDKYFIYLYTTYYIDSILI